MYKYCPHCGKPFLEPDKPRTVGFVSQAKEFITWAQIKEWSDLREASKHFEIGEGSKARISVLRTLRSLLAFQPPAFVQSSFMG